MDEILVDVIQHNYAQNLHWPLKHAQCIHLNPSSIHWRDDLEIEISFVRSGINMITESARLCRYRILLRPSSRLASIQPGPKSIESFM